MYRTFDVAVPGGTLAVGQWGEGPDVVLAVHGLTANHRHFQALAEQLGDEVMLIAPDLRGRGQSADVVGPAGMAVHADDLAAVLDHLGIGRATVVGHSMGAFVAVVTAHRHPDRVNDLVLIEGGIPLETRHLDGLAVEDLVRAVVGPALDRLRMTFPTPEAYLDYWRRHPALAHDWNRYVEQSYQYDLVGEPPELRSTVRVEAVLEDGASQLRSGEIETAVAHLRLPVVLVRAPRGLFDEVPPLYPDGVVAASRTRLPQLTDVVVTDVNHYTILLTERAAQAVAAVVRTHLSDERHGRR